jgi:hypothetical protein
VGQEVIDDRLREMQGPPATGSLEIGEDEPFAAMTQQLAADAHKWHRASEFEVSPRNPEQLTPT